MTQVTTGTTATSELSISEDFDVIKQLSIAARKSYGNYDLESLNLLDEIRKHLTVDSHALISPICDAIMMCAMTNYKLAIAPDRADKKDASVYFLQRQDGMIKIGFAKDVAARIRQLHPAAGSELVLLALTTGGITKETDLHKKFHHLKHHREWFRPEPELLAFIANINGQGE